IPRTPSPPRDVVGCKPRSASNSSTSRYQREKRKYHPTASRMTSGSNCRHLNKPQTEDARRSIRPAYHGVTAKLQHFPLAQVRPDRQRRFLDDISIRIFYRLEAEHFSKLLQ